MINPTDTLINPADTLTATAGTVTIVVRLYGVVTDARRDVEQRLAQHRALQLTAPSRLGLTARGGRR